MVEAPVVDFLGNVSVEDGTEGQAIVPAGGEIGDVHLGVAEGLALAPLEEGVALGASSLGQGSERVLLVATQLQIENTQELKTIFSQTKLKELSPIYE